VWDMLHWCNWCDGCMSIRTCCMLVPSQWQSGFVWVSKAEWVLLAQLASTADM